MYKSKHKNLKNQYFSFDTSITSVFLMWVESAVKLWSSLHPS